MSVFHFKEFTIQQANSILKVGTDAMVLGSVVDSSNSTAILDIGTGTGVLALMMAQKNAKASITAVEIDALSAKDCFLNFENSPWKKRLSLVLTDFNEFQSNQKFDLIICNPPFYSNSLENTDKRKASAKHAIHLPFEALFTKVASLLAQHGSFWMISPYQDKQLILETAEKNGLFPKTDYSINGKPIQPVRAIFCFSLLKLVPCVHKELTIRNDDNSYTEEYKILTADFHGVKL